MKFINSVSYDAYMSELLLLALLFRLFKRARQQGTDVCTARVAFSFNFGNIKALQPPHYINGCRVKTIFICLKLHSGRNRKFMITSLEAMEIT